MRDTTKKILGLTLATLTVASAFAGCGTAKYKGDDVDGYVSNATVSSNGGFAVEKGDYIYFINAQESTSANNKYGKVVKGALMRISKQSLQDGTNDAKTIVPSLFVSQNMSAGIYIHGDYVYYATPTTDKNLSGEVEYSYVDFKRAKLDGTEGPSDYLVRIANNDLNYRFVKAGYGTTQSVYCLYEEKITNEVTKATEIYLKSYNVDTGVTTTLVKGNSSQTFYFDTKNAENPNVYYTMPVSLYADSDYEASVDYNQLFCVNAAATVTVDTKNAKYEVYNGSTKVKEYDFDEKYMKEQNDEAEKGKEPYDLKDYTTYPYVNAGTIVLDGIGQTHVKPNVDDRFVWDTDTADRKEMDGYTYTVKSYQDEAIYFTRTAVTTTTSPGTDTRLYYLADANVEAGNSVGMNDFLAATSPVETVALDTTNTGSALFYKDGDKHYYIYFGSGAAYRAGFDNALNEAIEAVRLFRTEDGETTKPLMLDETNKFFYYYGGSGNEFSRINYAGSADDYQKSLENNPAYVQYQPVRIPAVTCNTSWYMPELFGDFVLYAGAQAYGASSTTYYYIHSAKLGAAADVAERVELYETVKEALTDYSTDAEVASAIEYYYRTGVTTAYDEAKVTYPDKYTQKQQTKIADFIAKFADGGEYEGGKETDFIKFIGKMTEEDADAIAESWTEYFAEETEETEDEGLPTWAIVLICVGGALIVAAGVTIPLVIVHRKKKAAALEAEATVNAYKRKLIDTTDDKSIDVYADEEPAEEPAQTEETAEEPTEEPAQTEETAAEETQENE